MPRRTLLSSEQRVRLFSIPIDAAEMTRYFVLSAEDLALIRTKRRAVNRLGFAIQLCALRHPGAEGPSERKRTVRKGSETHFAGQMAHFEEF